MTGKSSERQNRTRQHERRPGAPALAGPRGVSLQPPGRGTSHLPEALKNNVEQLAGQSLDDVTVRYHSPEPAKVKALAFTRGSEIHLAPGQAARLPHELWHVVQQKTGRVQPTARLLGRPLNDDPHLEAEAARMGELAQAMRPSAPGGWRPAQTRPGPGSPAAPLQRYVDVRDEAVVYLNDTLPVAPAGWAEKKTIWLPRFVAVQAFLSDITRTKPLLDELNKAMKARPLTEILSSQAEGLEWRADLPKLTEAVPGDQFADLVSQGVLFEDWVELQHGVQSHRLQWYLIQKQFPGIALALYQEMVHPDWDQKGGRKMWDLVVDSTASANAFDFTHPATLERYLKDNYRAPIFWRNRLATAIQAGEDQYPETKDMLGDKARLLAQDEEPAGPVQTEDGRWTGWKKFAGQWRPTIYYPN